jgi:hypothetical protein
VDVIGYDPTGMPARPPHETRTGLEIPVSRCAGTAAPRPAADSVRPATGSIQGTDRSQEKHLGDVLIEASQATAEAPFGVGGETGWANVSPPEAA